MALLGIEVQVDAPLHAQLWGDHHQESLARLQRTGVWAPTIVWMTAAPTATYWQWAKRLQAPLVTVPAALPPFPWIAIAPAAVARYQYPAECVAHKCPGHLHKGPLYYSLDTVGTVPAELHQALRTHLREHHGDMALMAPHGRATDPPRVLAHEARPGIWFHDLPALATLRGTVVAVDAGATRAGMTMAGVAQSPPTTYQSRVASGVGTSQEGEAMILLSYVRWLAKQPRVYWLVPDSEAAVGALRTYQEGGHCGDGIHHLYATVGGSAPLPRVRHQCGYHAVALDHGPQRPCGCGDEGAAGGGPHMAPQAPILIYPPSPLPRPPLALPDGAERLVAGPGLHTGAGRL